MVKSQQAVNVAEHLSFLTGEFERLNRHLKKLTEGCVHAAVSSSDSRSFEVMNTLTGEQRIFRIMDVFDGGFTVDVLQGHNAEELTHVCTYNMCAEDIVQSAGEFALHVPQEELIFTAA